MLPSRVLFNGGQSGDSIVVSRYCPSIQTTGMMCCVMSFPKTGQEIDFRQKPPKPAARYNARPSFTVRMYQAGFEKIWGACAWPVGPCRARRVHWSRVLRPADFQVDCPSHSGIAFDLL